MDHPDDRLADGIELLRNPDILFQPGMALEKIPTEGMVIGRFAIISIVVPAAEPRPGYTHDMYPCVITLRNPDGTSEIPVLNWVAAAEEMLHLAARRSAAGFEKAIELIAQGAMRMRTRKIR